MIWLLCHELGFQWIQQLPASFTEEEISAGTVHTQLLYFGGSNLMPIKNLHHPTSSKPHTGV